MEFERKDIRLSPLYPFLIFGDGYIAQIVSITNTKNMKGVDVYQMTIIPTQELAKRYNIVLDQLDENYTIKLEYPVEMITQLSNDPAFTVYFNFLNYNALECIGTKTWLGKINADTIAMLKRIIAQKQAENAYLSEQLDKAKTNIQRYVKEEIVGIASEMSLSLTSQQPIQQTGPIRQ